VPLASVRDTRFVLDAVARAVGASVVSPEALAARLGRAECVLALDNLEHLDGVGEVVGRPARRVGSTSGSPIPPAGEGRSASRPVAGVLYRATRRLMREALTTREGGAMRRTIRLIAGGLIAVTAMVLVPAAAAQADDCPDMTHNCPDMTHD
jgi:hypothetical protein